ncbi:MAG TPA: histidinol-phosphatase [Pirellulaceae bacterium]|jgi:histidinol phosphatase-like enzyme (inositol monophosphatase family)|nr:histidinol-phosphatase [Pirellulaceae bacterium]
MKLDADVADRLALARTIAHEAGELTLRRFDDPALSFDRKSDLSPVTVADREAETFLRERIADRFPADTIVGEEFGISEGTSPFTWALDPIDGTKAFITGVPLYTTLVGLLREEAPVAGVIAMPAAGRLAFAQQDGGSWLVVGKHEPRRMQVSRCSSLADARFVTSQVSTFAERGAASAYQTLERQAYVTRTWGDAFGYYLVACGKADLMIDPELNLWDAAAVVPVVTEAGGIFLDWSGKATAHGGDGFACNPALKEDVLAVLSPHARTRNA